ncbi:MAG: phage/plasmid primase, P4 family [Candidatus Humimicrobiaceae bacterium]
MKVIEVYGQNFDLWDNIENKIVSVKAEKAGSEWKALCPFHDDHNPSLFINEEKQVYYCHACGRGGTLYVKRKLVATYDHYDENGNFVYQIVRYLPKSFAYRLKDENGNWKYGAEGVKKILYRLPELIKADKDKPILFVEGGKDVDNVRRLGLESTTYFLVKGQWPEEYNKYFVDRTVVLCPDNDETGRKYSFNIGKSLSGTAKQVKWLELPELKDKEDISDWIDRGGTAEKLQKLIDAAPDFNSIADKVVADKKTETDKPTEKSADKKFNPRPYSKLLLENYNIKSDMTGRLWFYDNREGIWKDSAEDFLKSALRKEYLLDEHLRVYYVNEVIADLKQYRYEEKYFEEPPSHLIPFKNKIYDLVNDKFIDFSPEYFFVNKIPVNIDTENKSCPLIDSMLASFVGDDFKIDLYELAAYCDLRAYPYQKFFILTGEGRNGKSTYINIISKLIGNENISTINLKDIISNRFAAASLFKKLVNVSVETDPFLIRDTAVIKQLTGEDFLSAEEKFEKRFKFKNYAKLIIVTNKNLRTTDLTLGFGKRIKIINFEGKFIEGENADPFILDKITEAELEGFACVCLETLKNLYKRGFVFTIAQDYKGVTALYDERIQKLNVFLEERVIKDPASDIPTVEFLDLFNEYLEAEKFTKISQYRLIEAMETMRYLKKVKNILTESGNWTTNSVWDGIAWKQ